MLSWYVRGTLLILAAGVLAVFSVAACVDPYDAQGRPRRMGTHLQLGLPPCTFHHMTEMPCPSCGMTTSFALLVRGDLDGSVRANAVGTLLALFGMGFVPWSLACVLWARPFFIVSLERALMWLVLIFLALLLGRWAIVLAFLYWQRTGS